MIRHASPFESGCHLLQWYYALAFKSLWLNKWYIGMSNKFCSRKLIVIPLNIIIGILKDNSSFEDPAQMSLSAIILSSDKLIYKMSSTIWKDKMDKLWEMYHLKS